MYAFSCVFCVGWLVSRAKSTGNCISTAPCGAKASGRRPGGDTEISTVSSSIRQPDCETQAQKKGKDWETSDNKTI